METSVKKRILVIIINIMVAKKSYNALWVSTNKDIIKHQMMWTNRAGYVIRTGKRLTTSQDNNNSNYIYL